MRHYGKPIDRIAIAKSLTLRSSIVQKDRYLAAYLGISIDNSKANAQLEAAKLQAERMRLETQRLRETTQFPALHREWSFGRGVNPLTGRWIRQ